MLICKNPDDNCFLVSMDRRARCCGECGRWLERGELAWSYLASPFDGNYVECQTCRGTPLTVVTIERLRGQWHATFDGGDMPQGVPIPLPFTPLASSATVARDMQGRFPGAVVRYEGETFDKASEDRRRRNTADAYAHTPRAR